MFEHIIRFPACSAYAPLAFPSGGSIFSHVLEPATSRVQPDFPPPQHVSALSIFLLPFVDRLARGGYFIFQRGQRWGNFGDSGFSRVYAPAVLDILFCENIEKPSRLC